MLPQSVALYRQLHRIPEIGLQEYKTTQMILDFLNQLQGIRLIHPKPDQQEQQMTGVICEIDGVEASETDLFRCDIDALPFQEHSGVEFASTNGMHHACGHDAHTAMMLCAAKSISENRQNLRRNIVMVFQPGEEGHGGASKLLAQFPALLEKVQQCFAMHIANYLLMGKILIPLNYATANSNKIKIEIMGKSVHCLAPQNGIDANYLGCQLMQQIHSLRSRLVPPQVAMCISIPFCQGGKNVAAISDYFTCNVSVRDNQPQHHKKVIEHIRKMVQCITEANEASFSFAVSENLYRSVKNEKEAIERVKTSAETVFGQEKIILSDSASLAGEDFCEFSEKRPSCYFQLGVGLPESISDKNESIFPIHSNKFKLDESALQKGVEIWVNLALRTE